MKINTLFIAGVAILILVILIVPGKTGLPVFQDYTLSGYPYYFFTGHTFNANIIKGGSRLDSGEINAINDIIKMLPYLYRAGKPFDGTYQVEVYPQEFPVKTIGESDFDYRMSNGIVVGTPCNNPLVATLLGVKGNCRDYFQPKQGLIKVVQAYSHIYVVITGYSGEEVQATADLFNKYAMEGRLKGTEIPTKTRIMRQALRVPDLYLGETIGKRLPAYGGR
ncbi:hypothetical protein KY346_06180 [Candidatus Woesearchaeota archaeon]|nr:hypothetical protein [Candidatus Woesearchaeota archaeon]